MKLKHIIDIPCGLRYCFENLTLGSSYSRRYLLDMDMMESARQIHQWQEAMQPYRRMVADNRFSSLLHTIALRYNTIKDIRETIAAIAFGRVADDIELFEVKNLAMGALAIQELLAKAEVNLSLPEGLQQVVDILDPDANKILSFYVYDSYSPQLAALRTRIKCTADAEERQKLILESQEIEYAVRQKLTHELQPFATLLNDSLEKLVLADIMLAQAQLSRRMGFCQPEISEGGEYVLKAMFNPHIRFLLNEKGREFQKIDLTFGRQPLLIVGANMGGKTVVLKTLVLIQYLTQFGFDVPASEAHIPVKKSVFFCAGDAQSELDGLSSFGAEMKKIDEVIRCPLSGADILACIDEPARSTNPIEGTALVSALIDILAEKKITLLITTHYNIDSDLCVRMKVRGLENGKMNYALDVAPRGEVPHEALNVARSLGISDRWLEEAKKILGKQYAK